MELLQGEGVDSGQIFFAPLPPPIHIAVDMCEGVLEQVPIPSYLTWAGSTTRDGFVGSRTKPPPTVAHRCFFSAHCQILVSIRLDVFVLCVVLMGAYLQYGIDLAKSISMEEENLGVRRTRD